MYTSTYSAQLWVSKFSTTKEYPLNDVAVYSTNTINIIIAVSQSGYIHISSDSGSTWYVSVELVASFLGVSVGSNGKAFVVGQSIVTNAPPAIYTAANISNAQWIAYNNFNDEHSNIQLNSVNSRNGISAIAVGSNGSVFFTHNSGVFIRRLHSM